MKPLRLHLCGEYFDAIKAGTKTEEFRLVSVWLPRLSGKQFSEIILLRGYPRRGDEARTIRRAWNGYKIREITHPHFGQHPVEVLAIDVSQEVKA